VVSPSAWRSKSRSLLQRWVEQHADQDRDGNPRKAAGVGSAETNALRKRLRDVTEERDIRKRGLAYFADDQK
jgi:transposase-like protein